MTHLHTCQSAPLLRLLLKRFLLGLDLQNLLLALRQPARPLGPRRDAAAAPGSTGGLRCRGACAPGGESRRCRRFPEVIRDPLSSTSSHSRRWPMLLHLGFCGKVTRTRNHRMTVRNDNFPTLVLMRAIVEKCGTWYVPASTRRNATTRGATTVMEGIDFKADRF